ncbi:amidohydrolase [Streptomyces sp. NPDC050315]|uniref:amidohydrolase n=1 Tax=Streptomyces sp. NPDC050315 TaxID=3155039 RepID=UPI0034381746
MPRHFADLAITGATIHTLDPDRPTATALAVRNGVITAVGPDDAIREVCDARTQLIDGSGITLTPGLTDSHTHPVTGTLMTSGLDLSACTSTANLRTLLATERRRQGPNTWIRGFGLDPNILDGHRPHHRLIDDVLDGAPALLTLFDAHAALASTRALELAGVTGPVRFDSAAEVVCDADGNPTGELLEEPAKRLVERAAPTMETNELADRLADLFSRMNAAGLTGGHVMDCTEQTLPALRTLEERGDLTLRLRIHARCRPGTDDDGLQDLIALCGTGGRLWQVAGVKLFMDGTIDNGTAWLDHPDCHGESTRPFWLSPDAYAKAVDTLARAGVPTATHAIGDAAVAYALDCLAPHSRPHDRTARHRIEHAETLPDTLVTRFARTGVVASMQPSHLQYSLADHSDNWSARLGPERARRAFRCADLLHAGAVLALGSDWPIAHYDPREVLAAAQLRRSPHHPERRPVIPDQALTATEALTAMTVTPAITAGEAHRTGRLREGHTADLTGFATDPLRVPPQELPDVPIRLTIVDGRVVHRA